jgi:hypothetical protein
MSEKGIRSHPVSKTNQRRPLVITTCSALKRCRSNAHVQYLARGSQASVQVAWRKKIIDEKRLTAARELYRGRAFALAVGSADKLCADLGIISAGLGYVKSHTRVPSYDLTIRPNSPSSVANRVSGKFDLESWWSNVASGPFSAPLVDDMKGRPLVLLCLSRTYAAMVANDLFTAMRTQAVELRIFGLSIVDTLPSNLRPFVLPYDERLSQIGLSGTRVDFPQRALMHYVEFIAPETGIDLNKEVYAINRLLSNAQRPATRLQKRTGDEAIKRLIRNLIPQLGLSSTRILAYLRHSEGLSCEQRRFASLFKAVRAECAI